MSEVQPSIKISRAILQIAVPAIAQSFLQTLIFLLDRAFLGHYSTDALASLRLTGPLIWCITGVLSAFTVGSVALIGRAIGANDRPLATAAARASLLLALGLGVITSVTSLFSLEFILGLFPGVTPPVELAAQRYLTIICLVMPLELVSVTAAAMLQAVGNSKTPFLVAILANLVNLVLDYPLIFGHWGAPELGTTGAAIGSAAAMGANAAVLGWVLWRGQAGLTLRADTKGQEWIALCRVIRVSWPTFWERCSRSAGYLGFSAIITTLGSVAMATHVAVLGLEEICFQSAEGFGIAVAAIVAQRLGAERPGEAQRGVWVAVGMAVVLLGGFGLLFLVIPIPLLQIFTADPRILVVGVTCLAIAALAQPFMTISIVLEQVLRGAGDTRTALWISLLGWFVVRLIATSVLVFVCHLGLVGVWLGSTCDWVVRSCLLILVIRQGHWRKAIV